MKYRGNFDVDACERQFEKRAWREEREMGKVKFDNWEGKQSDPRKRSKGRDRAHEREQGRAFKQERD